MSKDNLDIFGIKALIAAGKGNVDFIAFAFIAVLSVLALIQGVGFWQITGLAIVFACIWVIMRYALLKLQSRERLQKLREDAMFKADETLTDNATEEELTELSDSFKSSGDKNGL